MLNQVILVGRVAKDIELIEKDDKKIGYITIAVSRNYKNDDGIYETDFISCKLWDGILEKSTEYINKGDIIAVRGRIENHNNDTLVVADKISFLQSNKAKDSKNE